MVFLSFSYLVINCNIEYDYDCENSTGNFSDSYDVSDECFLRPQYNVKDCFRSADYKPNDVASGVTLEEFRNQLQEQRDIEDQKNEDEQQKNDEEEDARKKIEESKKTKEYEADGTENEEEETNTESDNWKKPFDDKRKRLENEQTEREKERDNYRLILLPDDGFGRVNPPTLDNQPNKNDTKSKKSSPAKNVSKPFKGSSVTIEILKLFLTMAIVL